MIRKVKISKGLVEIEYFPEEDEDNLMIYFGKNSIIEDIFDDRTIIEADLCGDLLICDEADIKKIMEEIENIYEAIE